MSQLHSGFYLNLSDLLVVEIEGLQKIGSLECVVEIDGTEYFGINLLEAINNGGDGSYNGKRYFIAPKGHGLFTRKTNICRKISGAEFMKKIQETLILTQRRLTQYTEAVTKRDAYIQRLKKEKQQLKKQLQNANPKTATPSKSRDSFSMNEDNSPPSALYDVDDTVYNVSFASPRAATPSKRKSKSLKKLEPKKSSKNMVSIEKHSEYTKWSEIQKRHSVQSSFEYTQSMDENDMDSDDQTIWNEQNMEHYYRKRQPSLSSQSSWHPNHYQTSFLSRMKSKSAPTKPKQHYRLQSQSHMKSV